MMRTSPVPSVTGVFTGSFALEEESKVLEDYVVGQRLGEGAYGSVYIAKYIPSGENFALKILPKVDLVSASCMSASSSSACAAGIGSALPSATTALEKLIVQEATMMQALDHPHVVKYYKFLNSTAAFYFIMELAEGGELFDLIISRQHFTEDESRCFFQQLISATDYCHSKGVAHKDLKAENLLLSGHNRLLVCDFGFSSKIAPPDFDDFHECVDGDDGQSAASLWNGRPAALVGTLHYMSPEALAASAQDSARGPNTSHSTRPGGPCRSVSPSHLSPNGARLRAMFKSLLGMHSSSNPPSSAAASAACASRGGAGACRRGHSRSGETHDISHGFSAAPVDRSHAGDHKHASAAGLVDASGGCAADDERDGGAASASASASPAASLWCASGFREAAGAAVNWDTGPLSTRAVEDGGRCAGAAAPDGDDAAAVSATAASSPVSSAAPPSSSAVYATALSASPTASGSVGVGATAAGAGSSLTKPVIVDAFMQDLWSCGVILFFMLTGRLPFDGRDDAETMSRIRTNRMHFTAAEEQRISPLARELVRSMLAWEPTERPSMEAIVHHPWFLTHLDVEGDFPHRPDLARELAAAHVVRTRPVTFLDFSTAHPVTPEEESAVRCAFDKMDPDGYGLITATQVRDMLTTLHGDVVRREDVQELMTLFTGSATSEAVTFAQFRDAWVNHDLAHTTFQHCGEFQLANIMATKMDEVERQVVRQLRTAFNSVNVDKSGVIQVAQMHRVFERCHMDVAEEDLISLMRFFYDRQDLHHHPCAAQGTGCVERGGGADLTAHNDTTSDNGTSHNNNNNNNNNTNMSNNNISAGDRNNSSSSSSRSSKNTNTFGNVTSPTCTSHANTYRSTSHGSNLHANTNTHNCTSSSSHAISLRSTAALSSFLDAHEAVVPCSKLTISFESFVMGIVLHDILLRHPLGRQLAAATNLTALFHAHNVTECVRRGFLVVGLQHVVLSKLTAVPARLQLMYSDEEVSSTEKIYSFRFFGAAAARGTEASEVISNGAARDTAHTIPIATSNGCSSQCASDGTYTNACGEWTGEDKPPSPGPSRSSEPRLTSHAAQGEPTPCCSRDGPACDLALLTRQACADSSEACGMRADHATASGIVAQKRESIYASPTFPTSAPTLSHTTTTASASASASADAVTAPSIMGNSSGNSDTICVGATAATSATSSEPMHSKPDTKSDWKAGSRPDMHAGSNREVKPYSHGESTLPSSNAGSTSSSAPTVPSHSSSPAHMLGAKSRNNTHADLDSHGATGGSAEKVGPGGAGRAVAVVRARASPAIAHDTPPFARSSSSSSSSSPCPAHATRRPPTRSAVDAAPPPPHDGSKPASTASPAQTRRANLTRFSSPRGGACVATKSSSLESLSAGEEGSAGGRAAYPPSSTVWADREATQEQSGVSSALASPLSPITPLCRAGPTAPSKTRVSPNHRRSTELLSDMESRTNANKANSTGVNRASRSDSNWVSGTEALGRVGFDAQHRDDCPRVDSHLDVFSDTMTLAPSPNGRVAHASTTCALNAATAAHSESTTTAVATISTSTSARAGPASQRQRVKPSSPARRVVRQAAMAEEEHKDVLHTPNAMTAWTGAATEAGSMTSIPCTAATTISAMSKQSRLRESGARSLAIRHATVAASAASSAATQRPSPVMSRADRARRSAMRHRVDHDVMSPTTSNARSPTARLLRRASPVCTGGTSKSVGSSSSSGNNNSSSRQRLGSPYSLITHVAVTSPASNCSEARVGMYGKIGKIFFSHRAMGYGGSGVGAANLMTGVCDIDVILAPASLGYTWVRFRRIQGQTNDFREAVSFISSLLEVEREQAIKDTMVSGKSELM